jgi:hypothetical protein
MTDLCCNKHHISAGPYFSTLFHQACGQAAHQPRTIRPDSLQEMEYNIHLKNYCSSITMTALLLSIINTYACISLPELLWRLVCFLNALKLPSGCVFLIFNSYISGCGCFATEGNNYSDNTSDNEMLCEMSRLLFVESGHLVMLIAFACLKYIWMFHVLEYKEAKTWQSKSCRDSRMEFSYWNILNNICNRRLWIVCVVKYNKYVIDKLIPIQAWISP